MYGISEFRLGKEIVRREIKRIEDLGVTIQSNVLVGSDFTVDELFDNGFDTIFIGTGTVLPKVINIPGKELMGVMQATYLLRMVVLIRSEKINKKEIPINNNDRVVVIGVGNVGMDATRTAVRLGVSKR